MEEKLREIVVQHTTCKMCECWDYAGGYCYGDAYPARDCPKTDQILALPSGLNQLSVKDLLELVARYQMLKDAEKKGADLAPVDYEFLRAWDWIIPKVESQKEGN